MRWLAFVFLAACVSSSSVPCDFGVCPEGRVCDEENDVCAYPDQLTVCVGMPDGTSCNINGDPIGVCKHDICVTARCGDDLVSAPEVCDGDVPLEGTCIDYAYDYGVLGCTGTCDAETSGCHDLGWHFRLLPFPNTPVQTIWEDGDQLWTGGNGGLFHYDGTTWEVGAGGITTWVHGIWGSGGHIFVAAQTNNGADGLLAHYDGSTWQQTMVPGMRMWGVYGLSPTDVYAVGDRGTIRHWNGSTWTTMTGPNTTYDLRGLFATNGLVTAFGVLGTGLPTSSVLWMLDTTVPSPTWAQVATPQSNQIIRGVWGASSALIYFVGYTVNATTGQPLTGFMYRYGGGVFDPVQLPTTDPLHAIDAISETHMFASGDRGTILVYDGNNWVRMATPTTVPLQALRVGAEKVYAAFQSDYFLELDGGLWIPKLPDAPPATAAWSVSSEILFIVISGCGIYHLAKSGWTPNIVNSCGGVSRCPADFDSFRSVWAYDWNNAYAGAPYGYLYKRNALGSWDCVQPSPLGGKWNYAIWGSSPTDVFVGGADRLYENIGLAHYNGTSWTDLSSSVASLGKSIDGIWGTSATNVYFVGNEGAIIHYDGANFTKMQSNTTEHLHAIWGSSASDIFAVGDVGTIVHYDGSAWTPMVVPIGLTIPTHSKLVSIDGTGPNNVFVVGGRVLLHYNGAHWAPVQRPEGDPTAMVRIFNNTVQLAGENGFASRLIGKLLP